MTTDAGAPIAQSHLLNRLVLDFDTTEEVGNVDSFLINPKTHHVVAVVCKSGLLGRDRTTFAWSQIATIGKDSLLIRLQATPSDDPEIAQPMIGHEVWADSGSRVGRLADYMIHPQTGAITQYCFTAEGWQGIADGIYGVPPTAVLNAGKKRIMVASEAMNTAELISEGLAQKATQATEFLKSDYFQTRQDWESAVQSTQTIADQVQSKTKKIAKTARRRFSDLLDQVQQTADQVKEKLVDIKDQGGDPRKPRSVPGETIDVDSVEIWPDDDEFDPPPSR